MPHEEPLTHEGQGVSAGETNRDVSLPRVPSGMEWELHHIAAEDETTAYTSLRLGIKRGAGFIPLEEQKSPAAGTLYSSQDPWYLRGGDILTARFNGTTSADQLRLYANGIARQVA